ncbi:MAG: helix-turn-helix transcriptional regulator [bacterium]|nr:helix-turn-helix transcriptional regulator [bacterium]
MSTESKSDAMQFLESVTGGPLTLGELLLSIRLGEQMSQAELARQLGISRSHLCDLEKGRKTLSPRRAAHFARLLGYSETQFVRLALQAMIEEAGLQLAVEVVPVPCS